jgi:hypothetical protein
METYKLLHPEPSKIKKPKQVTLKDVFKDIKVKKPTKTSKPKKGK